eukprot:gene7431-7640_t
MQAAQVGLNQALFGMLEQWNIDQYGFPTNVKNPESDRTGARGEPTQPAQPAQPRTPQSPAASASAPLDAASLDPDLPPNTSPKRKLFQTSANANSKSVCNKGTPTTITNANPGRATFTEPLGTLGITMQQTNVIPPDPTLAVGPREVLHVVNSLIKIIPVGSTGGLSTSNRPGSTRTIPLPNFFSLVASPCDGGYINPSATYDKHIGRFLLTVVCGGDANQILLAASSSSSALGTWVLYSFAGEVTQSTNFQCANGSYPISLGTQVGYNQDGIFITYTQNCPTNQDTATGAILLALPKWAVYQGATYFWVPVWTAFDIYFATGGAQNSQFYPGAFLQLQPVMPQRPADVQAEVTYFMCDNLNYVNPLQRTQMTIVALINTGSLWLYEGPNTNAPAPLLVARVISRDVLCLALPTTLMVQPYDGDPQAHISPGKCTPLSAGAMLPPGFWSGGAALYANKIYVADRGPDLLDSLHNFQPTIYWAVLTPSFCVSGPCAPWFGTDWGWDDGWDWNTGTWAASSDRGKNGYTDPSFYNQVFLFPGQGGTSGHRRLLQEENHTAAPTVHSKPMEDGQQNKAARSALLLLRRKLMNFLNGRSQQQQAAGVKAEPLRDAMGVPLPPGFDGTESLTAARIYEQLGPVKSYSRLLKGLRESLDRMEALRPSAEQPSTLLAAGSAADRRRLAQQGRGTDLKLTVTPSADGDGPVVVEFVARNRSRNRNRTVSSAATLAAQAADGAPGRNGTVSAQFILTPSFAFAGWNGWGYLDNSFYYNYYQYWREYYFLRNLYMNLRIPPKVNPCKFYKEWSSDNTITFGTVVSRRGVIEFASTPQANPVGLAFPQVAVRGGTMLIVYSYSGPYGAPDGQGGVLAYPGVGYSIIPGNQLNGGAQFRLAKAGAGCIEQGHSTAWGSYSGIDIHHPSYRIWSAVEFAWTQTDFVAVSNAATWLNVFT